MAITLNNTHTFLNLYANDPIETDDGSFGQYSNTFGLLNYKLNFTLNHQLPFSHTSAQYLPILNLKRNGLYGYPSWKQIRAGENNISRTHRKNNILTFVNHPVEKIIIQNGKRHVVSHRDDTIQVYDEPPVVAKHKPLEIMLSRPLREGGSPLPFLIKVDYNNSLNMMTNKEVNAYARAVTKIPETYNSIKNMYLDGGLQDPSSPISGFHYLKFNQTVFPAEKRTFKAENRTRVNIPTGEFWKDRRYERSFNEDKEVLTTDGFYYNGSSDKRKANSSIWPLDVSQNWATRTNEPLVNSSILFLTQSDSTGIGGVNTQTDYGILQNNYNMVVSGGLKHTPLSIQEGNFTIDVSQGGYTRAAPLYNRKHARTQRTSVVAPSGRTDLLPTSDLSTDEIYSGEAAWDAPAQAGRGPFDDNIEVFTQHTKTKYKNYGVVPEYKINTHIDFYLENGIKAENLNLFELPEGGPGGQEVDVSSEENFYKIYSTSDFLENFNIIAEDHKTFAEPSSVKLTCNAVLKLMPYNGFYPAQRTVDLAQSFYDSYKDNIYFLSQSVVGGRFMRDPFASNFYDKDATKPFLQPLFSPGVLFNTIKSGIAVDHAIHNDNLLNINFGVNPALGANPIGVAMTSTGGGAFRLDSQTQTNGTEPEDLDRIPFEALLEPEEYLKNKLLYQQEPDLNASWDIRDESNYSLQVLEPKPIVWDGQGKINYKKMINNFLTETTEFFLENKNLTTYKSLRQDDPSFGNLKAGTKYAMRVAIGKTTNEGKFKITGSVTPFDPYEVPSMTSFLTQSFSTSPTDGATGKITENITMYSRPSAFGPDFLNLNTDDGANTGLNPVNTPPYYDGAAWTHIEFEPSETKKYTCKEILDNSNFLHYRYVYNMPTASLAQGYTFGLSALEGMTKAQLVKETTLYNKICMHGTASLNIFNIESKNEGTVLFLSGTSAESSNGLEQSDARLTIQTKFETPILNFNKVDLLTVPQIGSASAPRGMWHQYGSIPAKDEMIYLEITDVPLEWYRSTDHEAVPRESLADVLGFEKSRRRLGELAKSKRIKEAVVAVPFYDEGTERKFFRIPRTDIDNAIGNKEQQKLVGSTVLDMVNKMKQYNFPPSMDFLTYNDVDPFAMYIFEFEHVLSRQDLSYIWQNLLPDIGMQHKEASATITHELLAHELLGGGSKVVDTGGGKVLDISAKGKDFNPEIRWMVFKVKFKAKHDYYEKIIGKRSKLDVTTANINYNWPYDFFSLVELVKLDASVELSQIEQDEKTGVRKLKPVNSPNPMPVTRNFTNGIKKK
tara:strand:+ start:2561 stop:6421 length:3861 start_codon:yes stop_codon:yes gene_type:complete